MPKSEFMCNVCLAQQAGDANGCIVKGSRPEWFLGLGVEQGASEGVFANVNAEHSDSP